MGKRRSKQPHINDLYEAEELVAEEEKQPGRKFDVSADSATPKLSLCKIGPDLISATFYPPRRPTPHLQNRNVCLLFCDTGSR